MITVDDLFADMVSGQRVNVIKRVRNFYPYFSLYYANHTVETFWPHGSTATREMAEALYTNLINETLDCLNTEKLQLLARLDQIDAELNKLNHI